ncbi:MAG: non-heme iron oxygenase ferredoxin subunit [Chloroflexi bacterium]|nr:non-heme iron oxygenase ferredoxin subunit [Chloroflexota bacterium]MBI2977090.1 non-heme iron oxygenase ferredoxin subunit [Chloroflexota bacterium]MBI5291035.1 non-heme iron oxygenase ferredoxin subunit [Chloroflexota bacterium]
MITYKPIDSNTAEFIAIGPAAEVGSGRRKLVEIDGLSIAVFNIAGSYYAIADVCSHDDGPVAEGDLYDAEIECPRHGARFDVRTGKVLSFPAIVDIPSYPVKVENGEILVGLPPEG